ncbi:MAG TPA: DUF3352 domain-containing protein [Conexibacter sp.]|nr:DUF3352 domain-containing protein [Conexibacter sp.]
MSRRLPHGSRLLALLASLALLLVAGCGSGTKAPSSSAPGPDPATVAPASAAAYAQAIVRPGGDMKAGVLAAARKVSRVQDPGAALRRLLDRSSRADHVRFSRDVEPWLGQRVGAFLLLSSGRPDGAVALAIADRSAFAAAYARLRQSDLHPAGSYRGVAYTEEPGGQHGDDFVVGSTYAAPVGDFYVVGTLAGLRAAIDAQRGSSLADDARFKDAVAGVPANALAFAYADPRAIVAGLGDLSGKAPANARGMLARLARSGPAVASLTATADRIALEASVDAQLVRALKASTSKPVSAGQLPGDSWLALATPPLGPAIESALDSAGAHGAAATQVRRSTGLDLDKDLLNPLGGLALFVRGESLLDIGGGVLLQMTNDASAQLLLTRLQAIVAGGLHIAPQPLSLAGARGFQVAVPQLPQPIVALARGDKLAAGYGASSAQDLLAPRQRLDASPTGKAAIATLGDGYTPSFVLVVPPLVSLLRSLDALQVAHLESVVPYLQAYRSLALGTKRDGGRVSVRIVAALR